MKLRRILVPIDFSGVSRQALRYAVPVAGKFGAKITLLHVIVLPPYPSELGVILIHERNAVEAARQELAAMSRQLIPSALRGKTLAVTGQPYAEITSAARKFRTDLIVMTTHGHTGVRRVLLGSTAERVLRHAPCPVLSVPMG